jgi:hypothetical protein
MPSPCWSAIRTKSSLLTPRPLTNARPVVLGIRRAVKHYPYVILMSQDMPREEALRSGANEIMVKPDRSYRFGTGDG